MCRAFQADKDYENRLDLTNREVEPQLILPILGRMRNTWITPTFDAVDSLYSGDGVSVEHRRPKVSPEKRCSL